MFVICMVESLVVELRADVFLKTSFSTDGIPGGE